VRKRWRTDPLDANSPESEPTLVIPCQRGALTHGPLASPRKEAL